MPLPPANQPKPAPGSGIAKTRREPAHFPPTIGPPRGVLHPPKDRGPAFFHQRLAPSPQLAPFVQHLWYVQWNLSDAPPSSAETLPHPSAYLVFEHDLEKPVDDPSVHRLAEVSGVTTGKFSRTMQGHGRIFGLKFHPGGLRPFLHTFASTLTDRVVPAPQIFGPDILTLATRLRSADSPERMADLVSQYLAPRLPPPDPAAALASSLVNTILHDSTLLSVDTLARRTNHSPRSLQRLFKDYIGVSPKWVIRRFRLHELLDRLHSGQAIDGAQLALDLGYADQAHLINDFRNLVGDAPTHYLRRRIPRDKS